jgi:CheY-like chemotaxis protein
MRGRVEERAVARILIAEDEEPLRRLVMRALAQAGHDVVGATDGAEALELLGREEGRFDLLLSDIRMPMIDGIALAFAAARDYPALAIVLMTAYAEQRERVGELEPRIHDIIAKPFTLAEIKVAVADALAARGAS